MTKKKEYDPTDYSDVIKEMEKGFADFIRNDK